MTGSVARAIPWDIIGPAGILAVIILVVVFAFILKYQTKKNQIPAPAPPKDVNTVSKKTLCFEHTEKIAKNEATTKAVQKELGKIQEHNRQDHDKIFSKIDGLGKEISTVEMNIIKAINNRP